MLTPSQGSPRANSVSLPAVRRGVSRPLPHPSVTRSGAASKPETALCKQVITDVRSVCDNVRRAAGKSGLGRALPVTTTEAYSSHLCRSAPWSFGGQAQDRTADLPVFRIKDGCAGLAMVVYLSAERPVMYADRRQCTCMYKTTNETRYESASESPSAR